jgi:hypothetical protein
VPSVLNPRVVPAVLIVLILAACGGDDGGSGPDPDAPSPGFMVGSWAAKNMILTNKANPEEVLDLIVDSGASFTLDVQPSGRYLAILEGFGQSASESGMLSVDGDLVILQRQLPSPDVQISTWTRDGEDVILDGDTDFDFNLDGTPEAADILIVLTPR